MRNYLVVIVYAAIVAGVAYKLPGFAGLAACVPSVGLADG